MFRPSSLPVFVMGISLFPFHFRSHGMGQPSVGQSPLAKDTLLRSRARCVDFCRASLIHYGQGGSYRQPLDGHEIRLPGCPGRPGFWPSGLLVWSVRRLDSGRLEGAHLDILYAAGPAGVWSPGVNGSVRVFAGGTRQQKTACPDEPWQPQRMPTIDCGTRGRGPVCRQFRPRACEPPRVWCVKA